MFGEAAVEGVPREISEEQGGGYEQVLGRTLVYPYRVQDIMVGLIPPLQALLGCDFVCEYEYLHVSM